MKKLAIVATAVFFLEGFAANAQMHQGRMNQSGQQQGMMGPMHQGMMGQQMPMKKYMMTVNMLPNMQSQLSLSQDQLGELIDMRASFKKQQVDYQADLTKKRMKLRNLLDSDASAEEVRSQMQACSETKINMKTAAYETANQMKSVLTKEQQEQMKSMMMQQGGMMKGNMMQGGMNQGNMMKNMNQQ